ncbi:MAG: phosphoglycerate kinase [Alphaproteobacteria bacterium]|nr:phosphoglycerate kinase [Alphaproteobacteria bacterium]
MALSLPYADPRQLAGKTILMRVDFNLPMQDGQVRDDTRMRVALPGIKELLAERVRLVLLSHLGRPKGQKHADLSLAPVAEHLAGLLGQKVHFAPDVLADGLADAVSGLGGGEVMLAENLRFWPQEEANDDGFARHLAGLADAYINDAFSAAHRAHASIDGLARLLPAYGGPTLRAEITALQTALDTPQRPVVAVVGGAKISSKLAVLDFLTDKVDCLILGGGMANTFLAAGGVDMQASLMEPDLFETARDILTKADARGCHILLPEDGLAATSFGANVPHRAVANAALAENEMVLDIGPASIKAAAAQIQKAATLLWNGPLGAFEYPPFDTATVALARIAAEQTGKGALVSIAGGGDTVAALNHAGVADQLSYMSLAGGAFLEWLEGRELPGIAVLAEPGRG